MLSFGVPLEELLVSGPKTRLELMHLGLELAQMRGRAARVLVDRAGRLAQQLLLQKADPRPACERDIAGVWRVESRRDAQQRRLADAVRADEPDAVAVREPEGDLAEEKPFAEPPRDRLDRENAHLTRLERCVAGARWQWGQWNVPRPPTTVRAIGRPQRGHGSPARPYIWNSRCMRPRCPRAST